jgi:hypothetical protein
MNGVYEKMFFNQLLMEKVVDDVLYESVEDVALKIHTNDWDKDPVNFFNSFMKSVRNEYMTPYTIDDLKEFDLYKVNGYNIGFAIKSDGDIILVHNSDEVKGIGDYLMGKAKQFGGTKLDHFDGFLTGFYKRNGFVFDGNSIFMEEYAPEKWNYTPVNFNDNKTCIYVDELIVNEEQLEDARFRYENGTPDVVFRTKKR